VRFDAPDTVSIPAAGEVAVFRIIVEALNNVARHSDSTDAAVRIEVTASELRLEVTDHGTAGAWTPGVGSSRRSPHPRAAVSWRGSRSARDRSRA
jgi:signal transduction histidine kinase